MALVLDAGPIAAALNDRDEAHLRCSGLIRSTSEDLVIPDAVLVEVDYWCRKHLLGGAWKEFVEDIALGAYRVYHLSDDDLVRAMELGDRYADLGLGFVDAAVVATCERLDETRVVTLDRRHFGVVKPRHCECLEILPA